MGKDITVKERYIIHDIYLDMLDLYFEGNLPADPEHPRSMARFEKKVNPFNPFAAWRLLANEATEKLGREITSVQAEKAVFDVGDINF